MDSIGIASRRLLQAGIVLLLAGSPLLAAASGARQGVKPQPGEMVLLRDVSTRTAYRQAPPGVALIADPSPKGEIASALGTSNGMDELDDADFAGLGAGQSVGPAQGGGTTVERVTQHALGGAVGRLGQSGTSGGAGNPISSALGGPLGAVGATTRGIGDQVRGALAQFPLGAPAQAGGR